MNDCEMGPGAERRVASVITDERSRGIARAGNARAWGVKVAMAAALVVGVASEGSAGFELKAEHIIDLPGASGSPSNPKEDEIVSHINDNGGAGYSDVTEIGELLFKWNQGSGVDSSPLLSSSYEMVGLIDGGKKGGTIRYTGPGDIVDPILPSWLVIKSGKVGWLVYDLGVTGSFGVDWKGVEDLTFDDAGLEKEDGERQAISNVQIWGSVGTVPAPPPGGAIPEPSSFAIWGVCLGALGLVIRRRMVASAV